MAKISQLTNTWEIISEVDLRPLRENALAGIRIAIVGSPGSGRSTLAEQMRRDPSRLSSESEAPVLILNLEAAEAATRADLIILIVDPRKADSSTEHDLVLKWQNSGKKVLVFINQFEEAGESNVGITPWTSRGRRRVVWGSVLDKRFLTEKFAPAVIELAPDQLLGLARFFPLFRLPVAHNLINDTCFTNAAYSLSTGLAETIAVFNIPLAVADMVVLSKNQAFLAYRLGLALGFSTRWQDYLAEFGGVLGTGFLWRELAHTLVGLIPLWGIVPKVSIAYAGTYVVGNAILQWYLTERHISKKQMQILYKRALGRGKNVALALVGRIPRPHLPRRKHRALPAPKAPKTCSNCKKISAADASYCQYCGTPYASSPPPEVTQDSSDDEPSSR